MDPEEISRYVGAAFAAHSEGILSYLRRKLGRHDEAAEDVRQNMFMRVQKGIESAFETGMDEGFFATLYLHRPAASVEAGIMLRNVAKYAALDELAKRKKQPAEGDLIDITNGEETANAELLKTLLSGTTAEASLALKQGFLQVIRQTPKPFERAVLLGLVRGMPDDVIAARFCKRRIDVQRARYIVKQRIHKIFTDLMRD